MSKLIFEFKVGAFLSDEYSSEFQNEILTDGERGGWSISNLVGSLIGRENRTKPSWNYRYVFFCWTSI